MLLFEVTGQTLKRTDRFDPATDSQEYLKAQFTFKDPAWSGKTKTVLFRLGDKTYKAVLNTSGVCTVPNEVLVGTVGRYAQINGSTVQVSLIGEYSTTRITTNKIPVKFNASGYADAETPAKPTESEYQQMTAVAADAVAEAEAARNECEAARSDLVGVKNLFANAIKGNLSGAVVAADDVSPVVHNPVEKVTGYNLFNPDIVETSYSSNGLNITRNKDEITISGTTTKSFACPVIPMLMPIKKGKPYTCTVYRISGSGGKVVVSFGEGVTSGERLAFYDCSSIASNDKNHRSFVATYDFITSFMLHFERDVAFDDLVIKVQFAQDEATTEYTPYIDPSTVAVTRCGKNILDCTITDRTSSGLDFTVDENGKITVNGTATATTFAPVGSVNFKAGETYMMSGCPSGGSISSYRLDLRNTNTSLYEPNVFDYGDGVLFTPSENVTLVVGLRYAVGAVLSNVQFRPMIQVANNIDLLFEPCNATTHTPAEDGTVSGVTSVSPNMTILTDTDGVTVECEYIRDSNKVIDRLVNAIVALGGTV